MYISYQMLKSFSPKQKSIFRKIEFLVAIFSKFCNLNDKIQSANALGMSI